MHPINHKQILCDTMKNGYKLIREMQTSLSGTIPQTVG